jgi:hypothetical protein
MSVDTVSIYGASGHGKVVIDIVARGGKYSIVGIIGAGAVFVEDIPDNVIAVGVSATVLKEHP